MTYLPEWARENAPTTGMTRDAMVKYYKDHSVAGWCRFYLENPGETAPELLAAIQALADSCATKQKPAHRAERDVLARRWQADAALRNTADVPRITRTRNDDVQMYGWPPKPQPVPVKVQTVRHLPVTGSVVSFKPAKVAQRYLRRAA